MPSGPIIDTHLHLWDPSVIRYPWLDSISQLNRSFLLRDYRNVTESVPINGAVFIQCEAEPSAFEAEVAWISELAKDEPRLLGVVAWAPVENGGAVRTELERLQRYGLLRGIRRIIQFEPDVDFCIRPAFIDGVRTLKEFGLSFDICVDYRQMRNVATLAEQVTDVQLVLDHIGKPPIRDGAMLPWAHEMRTLSSFPNVACKISGVATEADHQDWTPELLRPYINIAIEAFGFDRIMFGSDWPVSTQAIRYEQWLTILDETLTGADDSAKQKFWYGNAARIYRLDGMPSTRR